MEIMKYFAGTCAPDASPECWEIFSSVKRIEHEQSRINLVLGLDIAFFLTAVILTAVYFYLGKSKRK